MDERAHRSLIEGNPVLIVINIQGGAPTEIVAAFEQIADPTMHRS